MDKNTYFIYVNTGDSTKRRIRNVAICFDLQTVADQIALAAARKVHGKDVVKWDEDQVVFVNGRWGDNCAAGITLVSPAFVNIVYAEWEEQGRRIISKHPDPDGEVALAVEYEADVEEAMALLRVDYGSRRRKLYEAAKEAG